jgi:protein farnesyltransferase subunit beta
MPTRVTFKFRQRGLKYKNMAIPLRASAQAPSSRLEEILDGSDRVEELSDSDLASEYENMGTATAEEEANITYLESVRIPIRDSYETKTSEEQDKTYDTILPFLEGNPNHFSLNTHGIPKLQRDTHAKWLGGVLTDYPAQFAMMDASRPWIVYWGLQSMTALGLDIHPLQKKYVRSLILAHYCTPAMHRGLPLAFRLERY